MTSLLLFSARARAHTHTDYSMADVIISYRNKSHDEMRWRLLFWSLGMVEADYGLPQALCFGDDDTYRVVMVTLRFLLRVSGRIHP